MIMDFIHLTVQFSSANFTLTVQFPADNFTLTVQFPPANFTPNKTLLNRGNNNILYNLPDRPVPSR